MAAAAFAPILILVAVLASDLWVYLDESAQCKRGTPIVFSYGMFKLDSPRRWIGACLIFWILFFPLYVVGRRH